MKYEIRHAAALLSTGHGMVDFYGNFLPILLPLLMTQFGLSLTMCGVLVMVSSVTTNMLQPVIGCVMDRRNFSPLLPWLVPAAAAPMCLVGYVSHTALLFLVVAVTGIAVAAYHPLSSMLIGRTAAEGRGNGMMSCFIAGGNAGMAFVPLILVAFLDYFPLRALPLLLLPTILIAVLFLRSGLCAVSTLPEHAPAHPSKLSHVLFARTTITLNLAMGLRCWTHGAFGTFLPLLLVHSGEDTHAAGLFLMIFMVGGMVGGLVGGNLADSLSGRRIIVGALLLGILPSAYYFTHVSADVLGGGCPLCRGLYADGTAAELNHLGTAGTPRERGHGIGDDARHVVWPRKPRRRGDGGTRRPDRARTRAPRLRSCPAARGRPRLSDTGAGAGAAGVM